MTAALVIIGLLVGLIVGYLLGVRDATWGDH